MSLSYKEYQDWEYLYKNQYPETYNSFDIRLMLVWRYGNGEYYDIFETFKNIPVRYRELFLSALESKIKKELAIKKKEKEAAARLALNRKLREFEGI